MYSFQYSLLLWCTLLWYSILLLHTIMHYSFDVLIWRLITPFINPFMRLITTLIYSFVDNTFFMYSFGLSLLLYHTHLLYPLLIWCTHYSAHICISYVGYRFFQSPIHTAETHIRGSYTILPRQKHFYFELSVLDLQRPLLTLTSL